MARKNSSNQIDRAEKLDAEIAQYTLSSIGASPEEIAQHKTVEAVLAARTTEKSHMVPQPVAPEAPSAPVVAGGTKDSALNQILGRLANAGTPRTVDDRRAEVRAEAQPLLTLVKSSMTSHGILKSKYLAAVEEVALKDWPAIFQGTTPKWEIPNERVGRVDVAKQALVRLQRAAEAARSVLLGTFGDSQPGRDDLDPVNAQGAADAVESLLAGDGWRDRIDGVTSQSYRRALSHLRVWAERAATKAADAKIAVEQFLAAQKNAEEILADVAPSEEPPAARLTLPMLPPTPPTRQASSYVDFDVREPQRLVDDGVVVTDIGAGAGKRVKGGR